MSPCHFQSNIFLDAIRDILRQTEVPGGYLELEVTESSMHGLGCRIIQGYFFSQPVQADDIPALMKVDFRV